MRLRSRTTSKDQRPEVELPEAAPPRWEAAAQFAMASVVVVWVTLATGSVQEAALAVSAVAAAPHLTRGGCPRHPGSSCADALCQSTRAFRGTSRAWRRTCPPRVTAPRR
jgi:hypothetical protein